MEDDRRREMQRQRRLRYKMMSRFDDLLDRQVDRIKKKLDAAEQRLANEYRRVSFAESEAEVVLRRRFGSGGAMGARKPTLAQLDRDVGD